MATKVWQGGAQATPEVWHATPTNPTSGDVYTIHCNGKDIAVTLTASTASNMISLFTTAINASTIPEWMEITPSDGTTYLVLTGPTDGRTLLFTETVSGTGTFGIAANTTGTGPHFFTNAENWDGGAVPVDDDVIIFEESTWPCLYGLEQSAVTPTDIIIKQSFTGDGKIGLPPYRGSGTTGYWEWRPQYLELGNSADAQTITVAIGEGDGYGSGRIKLNTGDAVTLLTVTNSGQAEGVHPAILWLGTAATNTVTIQKGSFGTAIYGGEASVIEDLDIGFKSRVDTDSVVVLGRDCDVDDIQMTGGHLIVGGVAADAIETLVQTAGTSIINGSDGIDALTVRGGRCYYNSTGTLGGAPIVSGSGILSFDQDMQAKTVTNPIEVYGDKAEVIDTFAVVTSLVVDYNETTRIPNLGTNMRVTRGTPA